MPQLRENVLTLSGVAVCQILMIWNHHYLLLCIGSTCLFDKNFALSWVLVAFHLHLKCLIHQTLSQTLLVSSHCSPIQQWKVDLFCNFPTLMIDKKNHYIDTWVRALEVHLLRFSSSTLLVPYRLGSLAATSIVLSNSSTFLTEKQIQH